MASMKYPRVPSAPIDVEEVVELYPSVRQSLMAQFDDCPLSALMSLKYENGWSTSPQARGTIFHLFAARALRTMQATGSKTIPVQLAEQIMIDATRQADVPAADLVRMSLRQMPELRMSVRKWAKDNTFNVDRIVDIERRLEAVVEYPHPRGGVVRRTISGQIDLLLFKPPEGAVVVDWKDTWALPPMPKERPPEAYVGVNDELRGISYHGFFQQKVYGLLVMKNYPAVKSVTLREFYVRYSKAREATITREQLPEIEEELSILVQAFDEAIGQGEPPWPYGSWPAVDRATGEMIEGEREWDIGRLGRWQPSPGRHCGFCARARDCPIDEDTRIEKGAPPATAERAAKIAAELQVINRVRDVLMEAAKAWVEFTGEPIPVKWAKGRQVLGWFMNSKGTGRRFGLYTPDDSDRGGQVNDELDAMLGEAMKEATTRARREREPRPRTGKQ